MDSRHYVTSLPTDGSTFLTISCHLVADMGTRPQLCHLLSPGGSTWAKAPISRGRQGHPSTAKMFN